MGEPGVPPRRQTPTTWTSQRRSRSRSSSRNSTRCQRPRHRTPSRTGIDSPAGPHQHRHAVRVAVRGLHVLLGHVLGAPVPVVVRVVVLGRDEPPEQDREVLEEAALVLVHAHRAGRVRRVDAAHAVADAALADRLLHLLGDVRHREPARRPEVRLSMEGLHRAAVRGGAQSSSRSARVRSPSEGIVSAARQRGRAQAMTRAADGGSTLVRAGP